MPDGKIDREMLDVIDKAVAENPDSTVAALEEIIRFKKKHRGLLGMHVSFNPFAPVGEDENAEKEKRAKDLLALIKAEAEGRFKDITNEIL